MDASNRLTNAELEQMVRDEFMREPMDYAQAFRDVSSVRPIRHAITPFMLCLLSTMVCALGLYFVVIVNLWAAFACVLAVAGCLLTAGIALLRASI